MDVGNLIQSGGNMKALKILGLGFSVILCLLISTLGIGVLLENYSFTNASDILTLVAGDFLIVVFAYFATKLTTLALVHLTVCSSCGFLIAIKEILQPGSLRKLFAMNKAEIYYARAKSWEKMIAIFPYFNADISLLRKTQFLLNPFSVAIASIRFIKEIVFKIINEMPTYDSDPGSDEYGITYAIYRRLKWVIAALCEILVLPLQILEPIGHIFYQMVYFVVAVICKKKTWVGLDIQHAQHVKNRNIMFSSPASQGGTRQIQTGLSKGMEKEMAADILEL
jgi:hypothetical protein